MNFVIALGSFLLGYFAEKLADGVLNIFLRIVRKWRLKRQVRSHTETKYKDIMLIASGVPFFSPNNISITYNPEENIFLAVPEDLRTQLPECVGNFCKEDQGIDRVSFPGRSKEEVKRVMEIARRNVAEKFIQREDGLYFNEVKYGVSYLDGFSRTSDTSEDPILMLKVYQTDHFTHRVLSETVRGLKVEPENISLQELNGPQSWMRTSFGLSIIVILSSTDQIVMTYRSTNASYSEGKKWIYVSATETFTKADDDPYSHSPDLLLCLERGIMEELGITKEMYSRENIRFYDAFFETNFYQDGVVASVTLKQDVNYASLQKRKAKDKQLEVDSMFLIGNSCKHIEEFIEHNKENMRSQTIFALKSYSSRLENDAMKKYKSNIK